jgi:hypothetical protein
MTCGEAKGKPDQPMFAIKCSAFSAKADNFGPISGL